MSTENLENKEALKKMTEMVEDITTSMMMTNLSSIPISAIPMRTKKVDENGDIWFLSALNSEHNVNIVKDSRTQLLYSDPSDMEFISIYGNSSIETRKDILEELYSKVDDAWFDGLDDPNLTAIKFSPDEAYYWDTKGNKYVSLFKMGVATITGEKADVGKKGALNL
ncbi:pyridoxamine 5'-phosphate oxidase family protein [Gillisia sp. M10.2A]|uniref:Pyridoxamine 5'-phosphate oxidase family protein n=1 Tax=Gillisia lutea TaxID=2909668 RepID=A0ABS9EGC8_9FLAO|nr:pyridoxamine 5'-phosphate oxidase family protein [Gillisia lutea]MCF4101948.1 pyridoxamine 5'-phosphate oxidase family protein [Gillisia lutea]